MNIYQIVNNSPGYQGTAPYPVQADEVIPPRTADVVRFLISNSGRTADVLRHADMELDNPTIIITSPKGAYGREGRTLLDVYKAKGKPHNWHIVELITPKEQVDAATGSVMEQAAIVQAIVTGAFLSGESQKNTTVSSTSAIADDIEKIITEDIGKENKRAITKAFEGYVHGKNKLYITGPDASCVAGEAKIKAYEILGGNIIPSESLLMVHGQEATMREGDVLLVIYPSFWERGECNIRTLSIRVMERGGRTIYIDKHCVSSIAPASYIVLPHTIQANGVRAYLNLAAIWKTLLEIGAHLNIEPDVNKGTRKVGNEEPPK